MGTSESYTFSELLKQFRVRSGLRQEELGKKLSVHRNTISAWERGLNLPETRGMVLELAKALDLAELAKPKLLLNMPTSIAMSIALYYG